MFILINLKKLGSMKKIILLVFINSLVFKGSSQNSDALKNKEDSLRKYNNIKTLSSLLYNSNTDGLFYCGITTSFELSTFFVGGEFKLYESYYIPLLSGSIYTNFKRAINNNAQKDFNAISLGAHFTFLGLEGTAYFNNKQTFFYIIPKVGFDYGSWSIFYGYGIPLSKPHLEGTNGHNINLKYSLYLSAFKYHKMRRKSMGY